MAMGALADSEQSILTARMRLCNHILKPFMILAFFCHPTFDQREGAMELKNIPIENPGQLNFVLGHSHFIKTMLGQ